MADALAEIAVGEEMVLDARVFVRERLTAGDTDAQVVQAVVSRYGAFVLLRPPVEPATYVLWFGPPTLVVLGLAATGVWLYRRRSVTLNAAPVALSPEEQQRLQGLLREHDR